MKLLFNALFTINDIKNFLIAVVPDSPIGVLKVKGSIFVQQFLPWKD